MVKNSLVVPVTKPSLTEQQSTAKGVLKKHYYKRGLTVCAVRERWSRQPGIS